MSSLIVLAFTGPKGSGKDAAASGVLDSLGVPYPVCHLTFASPIKEMARAILDSDWLEKAELNKDLVDPVIGASYRRILQTLGTEWGRDLNPDIWINLLTKKLEAFHWSLLRSGQKGICLITDVRFSNELDALKKYRPIVIRIDRPGYGWAHMSRINKAQHYLGLKRVHASERPLDLSGLDHVVELRNSGTLEDMVHSLVYILRKEHGMHHILKIPTWNFGNKMNPEQNDVVSEKQIHSSSAPIGG